MNEQCNSSLEARNDSYGIREVRCVNSYKTKDSFFYKYFVERKWRRRTVLREHVP